MAINPDKLLNFKFVELQQRYVERDAILYALGIGFGADPTNDADLDYLIETRGKVFPTFGVTLASPGMWIRDPALGVDFTKLVHSAQRATFHTPLPASASVVATPRVTSLEDRGVDRGAVLTIEREVRDSSSNELYCTVKQTLLLRGDGGFGGPPVTENQTPPPPDREPDFLPNIAVSERAALIYRLSGDLNPLHAEPAFAIAAGFKRPILHGLASYGMAGRAIVQVCGMELHSLECRFSGIVYPGDTLNFKVWRNADCMWFEAAVDGRRVLDKGLAKIGATR